MSQTSALPAAAPSDTASVPPGSGITVYGAADCEDTAAAHELLDRLGLSYQYVDLDADDTAAGWVRAHNHGFRSTPTISLGADGPILVEPRDEELRAALRAAGYVPSP